MEMLASGRIVTCVASGCAACSRRASACNLS
jgi:hypothetical protein